MAGLLVGAGFQDINTGMPGLVPGIHVLRW